MKIAAALAFLPFLASSTLVAASPLVSYGQISISQVGDAEPRLIRYSEDSPPKWIKESDKESLIRAGIKFMDITDYTDEIVRVQNWKPFIPARTLYEDEVTPYIGNLSTETMEAFLTKFTSFRNRYYKSSWGGESCRWLLQQLENIAQGSDHVAVKEFQHPWEQFSIVARFEGTNEDLKDELVIVGAHLDSMNMYLPKYGRAPGADDDGSGTTSTVEAFRSLVNNGFRPERPVEFHWYSGEEGGLLGSQAVSRQYQQDGKRVVAMLQNDMTGYVGPSGNPVIGIVTDHVDDKLTDFIKVLVDSYAGIPYTLTKCGYACSDHASWRQIGFPSAFTIESSFEDSNHYIHTSGDTIDKLSFDHMKEFSKIAIGFAVELSHVRSD